MRTAIPTNTGRVDARAQITALALDIVAIIVFAAIGRRSHEESNGIGSVLSTAAPFLVALLVGWGLTNVLARWRPQLRDGTGLDAGVVIWAVTVVLGLLARRTLWDRGTAFAFVIVATIVLAAFVVGRRIAIRSWETRRTQA